MILEPADRQPRPATAGRGRLSVAGWMILGMLEITRDRRRSRRNARAREERQWAELAGPVTVRVMPAGGPLDGQDAQPDTAHASGSPRTHRAAQGRAVNFAAAQDQPLADHTSAASDATSPKPAVVRQPRARRRAPAWISAGELTNLDAAARQRGSLGNVRRLWTR